MKNLHDESSERFVLNFLGNLKAENYKEFLHSHLDFFPPNLDVVSDEHRERFDQDISTVGEEKIARNWSQNMLTDCYWNLTEQMSVAIYRRMSYRKKF